MGNNKNGYTASKTLFGCFNMAEIKLVEDVMFIHIGLRRNRFETTCSVSDGDDCCSQKMDSHSERFSPLKSIAAMSIRFKMQLYRKKCRQGTSVEENGYDIIIGDDVLDRIGQYFVFWSRDQRHECSRVDVGQHDQSQGPYSKNETETCFYLLVSFFTCSIRNGICY